MMSPSSQNILKSFYQYLLGFFILTAIVIAPQYARSQENNPQEAQKAKAVIETLLQDLSEQTSGSEFKLEMNGDTNVQAKNRYYHVTTPDIKFVHKDGSYVDIGIYALNMAPDSKEGFWKMSMAMPTPITFIDKDGRQAASLDIGSQKLAGLFHAPTLHFIKADMSLENIQADIDLQDKDDMVINLDRIMMTSNMTAEQPPHIWSGPTYISLEGMSVQKKKNPDISFGLGSLVYSGNVEKYDLIAYEEFQETMHEKLTPLMTKDSELKENAGKSRVFISDLYLAFYENFRKIFNGANARIQLNDIYVNDASSKNSKINPSGEPLRIDKISYGFSFDRLQEKTSDFGINVGFQNDSIEKIPHEYKQYVPQTFDFDTSLVNLPVPELVELAAQMSKVQGANTKNKLALQAAMLLPQMLSKAGTQIKINTIDLGNNQYSMAMQGAIKSDVEAVHQATMDVKIKISGLDTLIQALRADTNRDTGAGQTGQKAPQNMLMNPAGLVSILGMIQMMGQQSPDDPEIRDYHLVLDKTGRFTVNGSDISNITGGGARQAPSMPVSPQ